MSEHLPERSTEEVLLRDDLREILQANANNVYVGSMGEGVDVTTPLVLVGELDESLPELTCPRLTLVNLHHPIEGESTMISFSYGSPGTQEGVAFILVPTGAHLFCQDLPPMEQDDLEMVRRWLQQAQWRVS